MRQAKVSRAFRPCGEPVEARSLATAGMGAAVAARVEAFRELRAERHAAVAAWRAEVKAAHAAGATPNLSASGSPIRPGLGRGLVRLTMPLASRDFAVVTIWNNTFDRVNLSVSVSTYQNGQYFPFSLPSGHYQSYYASIADGAATPTLRVRLGDNATPIVLPKVNIVYEDRTFVPAGKAGYPYAISVGVNGLFLSYV